METIQEIQLTEKQLENVRREIARIEDDGEEADFESNGARRSTKRAEIAVLYKREDDLLARLKRLSGQSVSYIISCD